MRIKSLQPVAVINLDVVAVAATPRVDAIGDGHSTGGSRQNRRSRRGGDVGSVMVIDLAGERVFPVSEVGGNCECLWKRPSQRPDGHPVGVGSNDLPAAGHKAAQQLRPQILVVRLHHQI